MAPRAVSVPPQLCSPRARHRRSCCFTPRKVFTMSPKHFIHQITPEQRLSPPVNPGGLRPTGKMRIGNTLGAGTAFPRHCPSPGGSGQDRALQAALRAWRPLPLLLLPSLSTGIVFFGLLGKIQSALSSFPVTLEHSVELDLQVLPAPGVALGPGFRDGSRWRLPRSPAFSHALVSSRGRVPTDNRAMGPALPTRSAGSGPDPSLAFPHLPAFPQPQRLYSHPLTSPSFFAELPLSSCLHRLAPAE